MRVLLVEDSERLVRSVGAGLRKAGYAVDVSADGVEGLWYARSNPYDVIVLDLMLPGIDGMTLLKRLRAEGKYRQQFKGGTDDGARDFSDRSEAPPSRRGADHNGDRDMAQAVHAHFEQSVRSCPGRAGSTKRWLPTTRLNSRRMDAGW